jgi:hypothetical protein
MSVKKILAVSILCTIGICFHCFSANKIIVIMPFQNNGTLRYDKLSDYIASYLILLFKDIPQYSVVPLYELKSYMAKRGYHQNDFKKQNVIKKIAEDFNIDYCIGGYFNDEAQILLIGYKIYQYAKGELTLKEENISIDLQNHDILTLNKNFDRLLCITEETTEMETESGILTVITDHECTLRIDGDNYGKTPMRFRLGVGEHRLTLIHGENPAVVVLEEKILIKREIPVTYNIPVFVPLSINAEEKCSVSINGEEKGITPYSTNLYSGREYLVEVAYYKGGENSSV